MECITRGRQKYLPDLKIVNFLDELRNKIPKDAEGVLNQIVAGDDLTPQVVALMKKYQITREILGNLEETIGDIGRLLKMRVRDLGDVAKSSLKLPLVEAKRNREKSSLEIGADAELSVEITTDDDQEIGESFRGYFGKFPEEEICLCYGIQGQVKAFASMEADSEYAFSAAAKGENRVALYNYFIHNENRLLLKALMEDLPAFNVPGMLSRPTVHLAGNQFVHIHRASGIDLEGELEWKNTLIETFKSGELLSNSLDLAPVPGGDFVFKFNSGGTADILIYSDADANYLMVKVFLRKKHGGKAGIKLGVDVGISGVDHFWSGLMAKYFKPIAEFVDEINKQKDVYGDLNRLFTDFISGRIDDFLNGTPLKQLEAWLKENIGDQEIQKKIREALVSASIKVVYQHIHDMQSHVDEVRGYLTKFIEKYQKIRARLVKISKKATELKIGIAIGREVESINNDSHEMQFRVNRRGTGHILRMLAMGIFTPVIREADSHGKVEWVRGKEVIAGFRKINNSLNISLLGMDFGQTNIFKEEWDCRVSRSGDISLGMKSSFESNYQTWRNKRRGALLLDTRLLAQRNIKILDLLELEKSFIYEISWLEKNPDEASLLRVFEELKGLGVLKGEIDIGQDLKLYPGKGKPYGDLELSVIMKFSGQVVEKILEDAGRAEEIFAANRIFYSSHPAFKRVVAKEIGLHFLLTEQVKKHVAKHKTNPGTGRDFVLELKGRNISMRGEGNTIIQYKNQTDKFLEILGAVKAFEEMGASIKSAEDVLQEVRKIHKNLLNKCDLFVAEKYLGLVFFRTLYELAGDDLVDPFLSVTRKADGKEFIFFN